MREKRYFQKKSLTTLRMNATICMPYSNSLLSVTTTIDLSQIKELKF